MGQLLEKHYGDKAYEINNVFHNLSNTTFTKEEEIVLALGLKIKPPAVAFSTTEFKQCINSYCSKLRQLKVKAYCGEINKEQHPLYGRVSRYIYKLHYKDKTAQQLDNAICESFGIPYEK